MGKSLSHLHVCITGGDDFVRRMTSFLRIRTPETAAKLETFSGNTLETKSLVLSKRPEILVIEIGFRTSIEDSFWLHNLLRDLRQRFGKKLYIIVAVTSSKKFVFAGNLLFENRQTLAPSGIVDSFIISPPPGIPSVASLELQLADAVTCAANVFYESENNTNPLPSLWNSAWAPALCDPISRHIWMRWLPRYAHYVKENPLIVGPTGAGKTRLAEALHVLSGRKGPFISITPRDFSSTELVQAELFGAVSGAYTGAVDKWGLVKKAEAGTLFIDELQSIDFDLQGKLITFIENKIYRRVGDAESHHADVRFVFASNRSLQTLVDEGRLRDDFAYRLERLQLNLPPLHERRLDIAAGTCFALAKVLRERTTE